MSAPHFRHFAVSPGFSQFIVNSPPQPAHLNL
jgi:hypothetical protein